MYFHYLQVYQERDQITVRNISIFLAITSSGSVAAWAIWDQFDMIWAIIIAVAQVVHVISTYLPYKIREKTLRGVLPQMHSLLLDCENIYDDVRCGNVTEKDIHNHAMTLRRQLAKLSDELYHCGLPDQSKHLKYAENKAKNYLNKYSIS